MALGSSRTVPMHAGRLGEVVDEAHGSPARLTLRFPLARAPPKPRLIENPQLRRLAPAPIFVVRRVLWP
jgi:hypothetical protein